MSGEGHDEKYAVREGQTRNILCGRDIMRTLQGGMVLRGICSEGGTDDKYTVWEGHNENSAVR